MTEARHMHETSLGIYRMTQRASQKTRSFFNTAETRWNPSPIFYLYVHVYGTC